MILVMRHPPQGSTPPPTRFEAAPWTGDKAMLPDWLQHLEVEDDPHHGPLLLVGNYRVRRERWVIRNLDRGEIFPVTEQQMQTAYVPEESA